MRLVATAGKTDVPYVVIILLVSLKRRMPFGDDTSNCSLWDLGKKSFKKISIKSNNGVKQY